MTRKEQKEVIYIICLDHEHLREGGCCIAPLSAQQESVPRSGLPISHRLLRPRSLDSWLYHVAQSASLSILPFLMLRVTARLKATRPAL